MTLNGVKKALNSKDSVIDELYNNTIKQNIIKSKLHNIKNILTTMKIKMAKKTHVKLDLFQKLNLIAHSFIMLKNLLVVKKLKLN